MRYLLILLLLVGTTDIYAQAKLSGSVLDAEHNEPLPGATVAIHELEKGVLTDIDGRFVFDNVRKANYHLHISYLGYRAVTLVIGSDEFDQEIIVRLEPTSLELGEVVVESNHYKTGPKEQTLSMEILDTEFLLKNRKGSFVSSLEDLPGVSAINTGVGISKPVIRGMSFNRVIVNDKGIKQEGQQWGSDHGLEIDMFDPGRVEVVKGPNSLLYGSDGLGGVINIFPPAVPQKGISGSFQSIYKSNNHLVGTSTSVEGRQGDFVYRGRFSTQDFGDYQVPSDEFNYNGKINDLYDEHLKNTAGRERNFSLMAGIKKDWGHSTITVSNFNQRAGLFVGVVGTQGLYNLDPDGNSRDINQPRQETNHLKVISNTNVLLGKNWLELDLGYQYNLRKEISKPHTGQPAPDGSLLALRLALQTYTLNARYYLHQHADHSRIVGVQGQYQTNKVGGFEHLIPDFQSSSIGAYIYEEHSWWENLTLIGGLRFDYANRDVASYRQQILDDDGSVEREYERNPAIDRYFFDYSAAVGLSFYPNSRFNAKLNIGSSFKVPTATDLSINGIHHGTFRHELGTSDLDSERGWQADLSLSYQRKNLSWVLTPYVSYFQGFIYLSPSSFYSKSLDEDAFYDQMQVYQYKQHDAFFTGTEMTIEYHPVEALHWRAAFEYIYNYNLETYLPLPMTPPASIFSDVDYGFEFSSPAFQKLELGLNAKLVFDQNRVDRNEKSTEGYFTLGASVGSDWKWGQQPFSIFLSASNLLDEKYYNHMSRYRLLNLPEQGRNFSVSLHIPIGNN